VLLLLKVPEIEIVVAETVNVEDDARIPPDSIVIDPKATVFALTVTVNPLGIIKISPANGLADGDQVPAALRLPVKTAVLVTASAPPTITTANTTISTIFLNPCKLVR
jgi:hypothetical protein